MSDTLRGAIRSRMIWFNVLLAVVGGIELAGSHLTLLFGNKAAAGIMLAGSLLNLALRAITKEALSDKAPTA